MFYTRRDYETELRTTWKELDGSLPRWTLGYDHGQGSEIAGSLREEITSAYYQFFPQDEDNVNSLGETLTLVGKTDDSQRLQE